jgi:hypothetical protein
MDNNENKRPLRLHDIRHTTDSQLNDRRERSLFSRKNSPQNAQPKKIVRFLFSILSMSTAGNIEQTKLQRLAQCVDGTSFPASVSIGFIP